MGFRIRKSISLGKGLRLNLGKSGVTSVTMGKRGAPHVTVGKGGTRFDPMEGKEETVRLFRLLLETAKCADIPVRFAGGSGSFHQDE